MPRVEWPIRVFNLTPHERHELVWCTIPLDAGTIYHGSNNQRELTVHDNRGPGSSDWVQYWPMMLETSDRPWVWRDDSLRLLRVVFPVLLAAGVANRGDGLDYEFFSQRVVTIRLDEHPTGNTFAPHPDTIAGLSATGARLHFEGDVATMTPLGSLKPDGSFAPAFEIQRPYGADSSLAWQKTFITSTRTIPPDWRTKHSMWSEIFLHLVDGSIPSSRAVDSHFSFGPSRVTEDDDPTRNMSQRVLGIQSPIYWEITGGGDPVMPEERVHCPVWPGTQSSRRDVSGRAELCVFDPDDWITTDLRGAIDENEARERRNQMTDGMAFPNRVILSYLGASPTPIEASTNAAMRLGQCEAMFTEHGSDFGPWGFTFDESINPRASGPLDAWEKACNHTNHIWENVAVGSAIEADTSGLPGRGRARRDPLGRAILGHHTATSSGGTTQDFGFAKCWVHTAPSMGNPDLRAWRASALQHARFPFEWRMHDGRKFIASLDAVDDANYPGLGAVRAWCRHGTPWNSGQAARPSWAWFMGKALPPAGEILPVGSGTGPTSFDMDNSRVTGAASGVFKWNGEFDSAHASLNSLSHYQWLRGDPFILWWFENVKNYTLTTSAWRIGPTIGDYVSTTGVGEKYYLGQIARAEARTAQLRHYLLPLGGYDEDVAVVTIERIVDSLYPHRYGNPEVAQWGPIPTEIPDSITTDAGNAGPNQPPNPGYQPFMLSLKAEHFAGLARVYREEAQRPGANPRVADMVAKLEEMATELRVHQMTQSNTYEAFPFTDLAPGSTTWIRNVQFITVREFQALDNRGVVDSGVPQGFGKKLTEAQMRPDETHNQNRLIFLSRTPSFPFQNLAPAASAMFRGEGTIADRTIAKEWLDKLHADAVGDNYLTGAPPFYSWGWGNGESDSSQYHTWHTTPNIGGPYEVVTSVVETLVDTGGASSGTLATQVDQRIATGGTSSGRAVYQIDGQFPQLQQFVSTGGKSTGLLDARALTTIEQKVDTRGDSSGDVFTSTTTAFTPATLPGLWCWMRAGDSGENVSAVGVGPGLQYPYITALQDSSGNGRHATGLASDFRAIDRRPGYRTGITLGEQDGGPYTTVRKLIGVDYFADGFQHYGNAYTQTGTLGATGEFYCWGVVLLTRGRPGSTDSPAGRDWFGQTYDDYFKVEAGGAGRAWIKIGGGPQVEVANGIPRGPTVLEVWRDASNQIHVEANQLDFTQGDIVAGTWDVAGFGYVNDAATTNSYFDDFLLEWGMCDQLPSAAERQANYEWLATYYQFDGAKASQGISVFVGTGGTSGGTVVPQLVLPLTQTVGTGGTSSGSVTTATSGAATIFQTVGTGGTSAGSPTTSIANSRITAPPIATGGNSSGAFFWEIVENVIEVVVSTGGTSRGSAVTTATSSEIGSSSAMQDRAYYVFCNPDRFGTVTTYYPRGGAGTPIRCLIDWQEETFRSGGTNSTVDRWTVHIARHPLSILSVTPGVDLIDVPSRPGGALVRGRVARKIDEAEDFLVVEVQR